MAYPQQPMPAPQPQPAAPAMQGDDGKLSHAEVHYGMAKPNGERCARCKFYNGPNDCEIVAPPIYPAGWCEKFQASGAAAQPDGISQAAPAAPAPADQMAHGRAIAGARALHAVGHISRAERDKHIGASRAAMGGPARKPFGSFSPEVER